MSGPLVSVVIPSYNYAGYIGQTIESALAQTYSQLEVIVVDDGSTDDSLSVIGRFGDRVRVFQQENSGPSRARNLGIEHSRGDHVAFLDSDDLWDPEKIAKQVDKLNDPRVGLVNCGIEYIDAQNRPMWVSLEGVEGKILRAHARFRERTVGPPSAVLARRACFHQVGMFDPALSMSADWDMWRRIGSSYDVAMVREPLLKYRVHNAALHHNVDLLARDMVYAFDRMFDDPRSSEIHGERRACYANMYATLCGSYLHKGQWKKAMHFAVRSLKERPDRLLMHTLGVPARRVRRWAFGAPPA